MGLRFSRIGSDPYYSNYERSFEKLEAEDTRLKEQILKYKKGAATFRNYSYIASVFAFVLALLHAAWVKQNSSDDYSWREEASRVGIVVLVMIAAYLAHEMGTYWYTYWEGRCQGKLKRLQDSKKKMIRDLKDSTRFEKTMALLKKYDAEQTPQTPLAYPFTPGLQTPMTAYGRPPATPATSSRTRPTAATAAAATFSNAGKLLMPVFDKLATTLVGDNPTLVDEVRRCQQQVQEAHRQAHSAAAEAFVLKEQNTQLARLVQELAGKCDEAIPGWVQSVLTESARLAQNSQSGSEHEHEHGGLGSMTPGGTPRSAGSGLQQLLEEAAAEAEREATGATGASAAPSCSATPAADAASEGATATCCATPVTEGPNAEQVVESGGSAAADEMAADAGANAAGADQEGDGADTTLADALVS